ncbi:putative F-box domain, FBD domain, leucine-rich repeat domain superfamily [Helianthus annuus]|nr:putative F-box domain, FBD domain, leucine-rich repeat domain superfamily [Helianthus annuus]
MRSQRRRAAPKKEVGCDGSNSDVLSITDMPYEILIFILSLLPVKDAVVTSSVTKKWRFLWHGLTHLNFDAMKIFFDNTSLYRLERSKFIEQVNSVIRNYNHPVVHRFRINLGISDLNQRVIDEWLQFAVNKKVEILELDLNYDFPLILPNSRYVEFVSLKKLYLNNVKLRAGVLEDLLTRSPQIESISIHDSTYMTHIRVAGRHLNLKHFEIVHCRDLQSLYLSDFDLVSFIYKGRPIDICLTNLPKLKEVNLSQALPGLDNKVFNQVSSCASSLQALSITFRRPEKLLPNVGSMPQLPNLKKLMLTTGAYEDDCLLEFASVAKAFPVLETFIFKLLWCSPTKRRRKVRHVANDHCLENLKLFKILGYYGRISDLELAAYVIEHAVALQKIVIDPGFQHAIIMNNNKDWFGADAARSSAKRQLKRIVPMKSPGVKLVIL